jgi:hypothetical protein
MAKEIARLLQTEFTTNVKALPMIAKLLQSQGRRGDKILAHITPKEAEKLKKEGGSGTINPKTGLPEYYEEGDIGVYDSSGQEMSPQEVAASYPDLYPGGQLPAEGQATQFAPGVVFTDYGSTYPGIVPSYIPMEGYAAPQPIEAGTMPRAIAPAQGPVEPIAPVEERSVLAARTPEESAWEKFTKNMTPQEKRNLAIRSALGIGGGLLAGLQGRRAIKQAQQAKSEIGALGTQQQQIGKQMQEAALRGELTPANRQRIQAAQAQLAPKYRSGTAQPSDVMRNQMLLENIRQQLLDTQYNAGLRIAQIGDQYAFRAIQTGLSQDKSASAAMKAFSGALAGFMGMQPNQPA